MNTYGFTFHGAQLLALPSGGLFWPEQKALIVSDLHMGKAARQARYGGAMLPPYETRETLTRLDHDLGATGADHVICLGDSFDAPELDSLIPDEDAALIKRLQANRRWSWIEGNHDPAPVAFEGDNCAELMLGALVFRHIAQPRSRAEISGHYHPKARLPLRGSGAARPCFLVDESRIIMPAYGAYTGGLWSDAPVFDTLMAPNAVAILTGAKPCAIPMPRSRRPR